MGSRKKYSGFVKIKDGQILRHKEVQKKLDSAFSSFKDGIYRESYEKYDERTQAQNNYYHLLVRWFMKMQRIQEGNPLNFPDAKYWFKMVIGFYTETTLELKNSTGRNLEKSERNPRSSKGLTRKEFSEQIVEPFKNWSLGWFNVLPPDPDDPDEFYKGL